MDTTQSLLLTNKTWFDFKKKKKKCFRCRLKILYFLLSTIQHESQSSTTIDMLKDCSPCSNKLIKISEKHAKFLMENLNLLRKQRELCDVILVIGQNRIAAHRAVLSGNII